MMMMITMAMDWVGFLNIELLNHYRITPHVNSAKNLPATVLWKVDSKASVKKLQTLVFPINLLYRRMLYENWRKIENAYDIMHQRTWDVERSLNDEGSALNT